MQPWNNMHKDEQKEKECNIQVSVCWFVVKLVHSSLEMDVIQQKTSPSSLHLEQTNLIATNYIVIRNTIKPRQVE